MLLLLESYFTESKLEGFDIYFIGGGGKSTSSGSSSPSKIHLFLILQYLALFPGSPIYIGVGPSSAYVFY